ncbi:hypothetical protein [Salinispora arenicola]|uniref:hypothetical protein n=1 Tax=Salinispora arenicola TaxID=168697 RepID=UPI00037C0B7E|nr:hypothetical protein [Salinispora arenicola]
MATPSPRTATTRLLGSLALVTGLLVSTITLSIDPGSAEPHLLAALFVGTGIGLCEAATSTLRPRPQESIVDRPS